MERKWSLKKNARVKTWWGGCESVVRVLGEKIKRDEARGGGEAVAKVGRRGALPNLP